MLDNRGKLSHIEVNMQSLKEWKEEQKEINEMSQMPPMSVVQQVMARIAPMVASAHQQIEDWPNEREKSAARKTLDAQLLRASRNQWMGKARQATSRIDHGMAASQALKRFGGLNTAASNQLA